MSLLQNSNAIPQLGGYNLTDSVRFRSSASAYLSRTNSSAPTNAKIGSLSVWVKRGSLATGNSQYIMETGTGTSNNTHFQLFFNTSNNLSAGQYSQTPFTNTSVYFRDTAAWYHIFIAYDSTQATAADRFKLYVNNTLYSSTTTISLNNEWAILQASQLINIGRHTSVARHFDGYMTEFNVVDGQALTPSDFGEYDDTTGVWKPKEYTGTYGNNGWYLDMSTSGSTVTDQSGNGNNWTATNMNLTTSTATTYDIMSDVPTLTDEDTGNFATLNPLNPATNQNISQGNLRTLGNAINHVGVIPTILPKTGKWYIEFDITTANTGGFGFTNIATPITSFPGVSTGYWWIYGALTTGYAIHNQTSYASYTDTRFNTGNLGQMALDFDNGKVWVGSNNVWINATNGTNGNPSTGANPTWTMTTGVQYYPFWEHAATTTEFNLNFGQRPFAYTPPTGYKKLNTYNLSDSAVKDGSQYFNTVLYSGTGSSHTIDTGMYNDFTWLKMRSSTSSHYIWDAIRGFSNTKGLDSRSTGAEGHNSAYYTVSRKGDNQGFIINDVSPGNEVNSTGNTYVAWNWRANDGSSGVSNTNGSITSTVSANTTSGFSVVAYTGSGSNATVGHGLSSVPKMVIVKNRDEGWAHWGVYHKDNGGINSGHLYSIALNLTGGASLSSTYWNNTAPTSSVFSIGTDTVINNSGSNIIAYCFAEVEGFSKFGSYTGNGSADGPFIYTGFKPAFVMTKCSSTTGNWMITDIARNTYNVADLIIMPNNADTEYSQDDIDILSNGFKMKDTVSNRNLNGATFIYMAFAESPFKNSLAR